jgi:O-antigen/teichoic acid export membrane protein
MTSHTTHKAVRNIFFSGIRLVIGSGAGIFTSAIIARTLGPVNMGVYGYAMWLVGTLGILANIGLPAAITKYVSEFIGSGDTAMAVRVGKRLLLTQLAVAGGLSLLTACFVLLKTQYRGIIVLAAVMLLAQALQQSLTSALAGVQRFDQIALIGVYVGLAQIASVGIAVLLHSGVMGMLWATLAALWMGVWLYYRAVGRCLLRLPADSLRHSLPEQPDIFRRITRFSFTISYVLLLDTIIWQRSEVLFLKRYSTLSEIAFYTLAYAAASKLGDIASTLSSTLLPLYSESYGRDRLQQVGQIFKNAMKYLQMVMVPLSLLAAAIARPLVHLLYGLKYMPSVLPLQILLICQAFTSIGMVSSPLVMGTEKQGFIAKYGTLIAVLNIALDIILIPKFGALGAAGANCAAQFAGVLGGTFYTVRYIGVRFPWRATVAIYSATVIALAPAAYLANLTHSGIVALVGCVAVGSVLYPGMLVLFGELGKRDLNILKTALLSKVYAPKPLETAALHPVSD